MELYRYSFRHGEDKGLWANLQSIVRGLLSIGFAVCDYDRPDMFLSILSKHDKRLKYFRLDVPGPGKYGMDISSPEELQGIVDTTRSYFEQGKGKDVMSKLVNELVETLSEQ